MIRPIDTYDLGACCIEGGLMISVGSKGGFVLKQEHDSYIGAEKEKNALLIQHLVGCSEALASYAPDCIEVELANRLIQQIMQENINVE